jgi:DNA-binding CsgD family transcriptional regulator
MTSLPHSESSPGVCVYSPNPADIDVLWQAHTQSADNCVLLSRADGYIYYANATARRSLSLVHPDEGYHMHAALPASIADEHLRCVKRVLTTGRTMVLFSMVGGIGRVVRFAKIHILSEAEPSALIICSPLYRTDPFDAASTDIDVTMSDSPDLGNLSVLTARELEVLRYIGLGLSTDEIGKRIHRSPKTVEWHRASLGEKLHAANRIALAKMAMDSGLVTLSDRTFEQLLRRLPRDREQAEVTN